MILKKFKPINNSTRHKIAYYSDEVTYKGRPYNKLSVGIKKPFGHSKGRKVCNKRSGSKKLFRIVDFKRNKFDIQGEVIRIERDPNRTCNIALVKYTDGEHRYIISPKNLKVGQNIVSSQKTNIEIGNCLPLKNIPVGVSVHNIELNQKQGGILSRSAGSSAKIIGFSNNKCILKLSSGETRMIDYKCLATIGIVGNIEKKKAILGKAGKSFHLGKRPHVRGLAKNPSDHPHGGGSDRTSVGRIPVVTKSGIKRGVKTRQKRKFNSKMILKRRK